MFRHQRLRSPILAVAGSTPIAPWLLLLSILLLPIAQSGCRQSAEPEVDVAAGPPPLISGRYDVRGFTHTAGTADRRRLEGTVILVQNGDEYTATYELKTRLPSEGIDTDADVVGVGEGTIAGGRLEGQSRTQLVISVVPGIDTHFPFVPRKVSARLESNSIATVSPDGTIEIELENRAAQGENYEPTVTRLIGQRVEKNLAVRSFPVE